MRKPAFCIYKIKGIDQLCGNYTADIIKHLCFRYIDSAIPLLPKSEISNQNKKLRSFKSKKKKYIHI